MLHLVAGRIHADTADGGFGHDLGMMDEADILIRSQPAELTFCCEPMLGLTVKTARMTALDGELTVRGLVPDGRSRYPVGHLVVIRRTLDRIADCGQHVIG